MKEEKPTLHPSARIGKRSRIWGLSQIREGATIGDDCTIGRNVYIDHDVVIGSRVKIQNNALIYFPARIAKGVFIGPGVIITNDKYPRAVTNNGSPKSTEDWEPKGVVIEEGVSIGAGVVVISGVRIGTWAVIGAGAVVTSTIPPFSLAVGVPARVIGKVKKCGHQVGTSCECQ